MSNTDRKTVEYMYNLQDKLDKLSIAIEMEDFETQFYMSQEIERIATKFSKYQVQVNDNR